MGGDIPKQFRLLAGSPMVIHTIKPFFEYGSCAQIIVAVHPEWKEWVQSILDDMGWSSKVKVVYGGEKRGDSVYHGLKALKRADIVLVHDAVRPFVSVRMIEEAAQKAWEYGGAAIAVPIIDTVKREDEGIIRSTVNRSKLWQVQTPQAFRYNIIMKAYEIAQRNGFNATDDCRLLEKYTGIKVKLVLGSRLNIKITTPEDFLLAKAIMKCGMWNAESQTIN